MKKVITNPNEEINSSAFKKMRLKAIAKLERKCDRCSPHGGENARRTARPDRHKNKDRGSIRKQE
jgi:hypothetical protein